MTKQIRKLTKQQEELLQIHKQKMFEIGVCTDPADWERAEKAITKLYELFNFEKPTFYHMPSPKAAKDFLKQNNAPKSNCFFGAHEIHWIGFYEFGHMIGVEYKESDYATLQLWYEIAKSITWWYPYEKVCVLVDRPEIIKMKNQKLHCENGPSVRYRDGFEVYSLNGVRVPKWLVMKSPDEIDPIVLTKEKNAEIRREIVRKLGIERIYLKLGAVVIDKLDDYELITLNLGDGRMRPFLKMVNPSINTKHIEGVHPNCKTVIEALAWRNSQKKYEPPEILT